MKLKLSEDKLVRISRMPIKEVVSWLGISFVRDFINLSEDDLIKKYKLIQLWIKLK